MSPADIWVRHHFPNLRNGQYRVTSDDTRDYNCLAWAAGEVDRKWDPKDSDHHWPDGVPREQTMPAFIAAYSTCHYVECDNGEFEEGFEKIAIYANQRGPQHAAKQLNGAWSSKLGDGWDIEHPTLEGIENSAYGKAVVFMKRAITLNDSKLFVDEFDDEK
jgi:hypothetical protein